jgi:hypothetical protein
MAVCINGSVQCACLRRPRKDLGLNVTYFACDLSLLGY